MPRRVQLALSRSAPGAVSANRHGLGRSGRGGELDVDHLFKIAGEFSAPIIVKLVLVEQQRHFAAALLLQKADQPKHIFDCQPRAAPLQIIDAHDLVTDGREEQRAAALDELANQWQFGCHWRRFSRPPEEPVARFLRLPRPACILLQQEIRCGLCLPGFARCASVSPLFSAFSNRLWHLKPGAIWGALVCSGRSATPRSAQRRRRRRVYSTLPSAPFAQEHTVPTEVALASSQVPAAVLQVFPAFRNLSLRSGGGPPNGRSSVFRCGGAPPGERSLSSAAPAAARVAPIVAASAIAIVGPVRLIARVLVEAQTLHRDTE